MRARVMRNVLRRRGVTGGRAIRAADAFLPAARSGASLDLPGALILQREFDRFVIRTADEPAPDRPLVIAHGAGSGAARIGGRTVHVAWGPAVSGGASLRPDLAFPLVLRARRPGDRIRLDYGTKKLKKLFAERRLARSERSRVPVLADAAGTILWVPGIAMAVDARSEGDTAFRVALTG